MEMTFKRLRGFTLTELIIVVVVLGIMAGFAIPNYTKSIDRAYRKDGTVNLTAIYAAQQIYSNNNNGSYWTPSGGGGVADINASLGLGILSNNLTYSCSGGGATFSCTATRGTMTLKVTDASATPTCSGYCP